MASFNYLSNPSKRNGRIPWLEAPSIKQLFSLPDSIIFYIAKNPSTPKCYLKLAKSCKYFFEMKPLLIIKRIYNGGKKFCSNDRQKCYSINCMCCITIDIAKVTNQIWITDEIKLCFNNIIPKFAELLIPRIYESEEALLSFMDCEMNIEEFKLFASKFRKFCLKNVKIIDADGKIVMFEAIIESILNIKEFEYHFHCLTSAVTPLTMNNILYFNNLDNLCDIRLHNIPNVFNIKDVAEFMKTHKNTKFWLDFEWNIIGEYKNQLDALIDEVIESGIPNHLIHYSKLEYEKQRILKSRFTS